MSRGIIVIEDFPQDCHHCDYALTEGIYSGDNAWCRHAEEHISGVEPGAKLICCPIQEMPEKKDVFSGCANPLDTGYAEGWNACLNALLNGGERK